MEIKKLAETLEDIKHTRQDGSEYWYARSLWDLLGYSSWRNFEPAIQRAMKSCESSGFILEDHFVNVRKMVDIGSGSQREVNDYELTRYACYLIAQNGDPRILEIAFAQRYFAIQTRKQELVTKQVEEIERLIARKQLTETDKEFAGTVLNRNVDRDGLKEIISIGDYVLFGSNSTKDMKRKLRIHVKNRALADFLPTITIKAKDLAAEATTFNTKEKDLFGKDNIRKEHIKSSQSARNFLLALDIVPENLPPAEDIRKVERRHEKQKKLAGNPGKIQAEDTVEELRIEIPLNIEDNQLLTMKQLFDSNPGTGKIMLKFNNKTILLKQRVKITEKLSSKIMEILNGKYNSRSNKNIKFEDGTIGVSYWTHSEPRF